MSRRGVPALLFSAGAAEARAQARRLVAKILSVTFVASGQAPAQRGKASHRGHRGHGGGLGLVAKFHRSHRSVRASAGRNGHTEQSQVFIFFFFGVPSIVPVTIELPDLDSQTRFNIARWAEVLADPALAQLPHRIETDQHGHLLMSPPPAPIHGRRQAHIAGLLRQLLPEGIAFSECPISTAGGVKAVDVAWLAPERPENISQLTLFERAPEICAEIVSPSNSRSEISEKRALYFDAGATEVWVCALDGSLSFFVSPRDQLPASSICPAFPDRIP
jgi:Uma2 family endonuclease